MATQDFSFSNNKDDDIKNRQAILALQNNSDIDCLSDTLKKRRCRILGKSQQLAEVAELLRKHKSGVFFLDFDIEALASADFISSLAIKHPDIKIVLLAKTMNKEQLDYVKSHGIKRFLAKPLTDGAINKLLSSASF